eukprot:scaffold1340_cov253-Pinguiococcus_pyrenoidosus.AAC.22
MAVPKAPAPITATLQASTCGDSERLWFCGSVTIGLSSAGSAFPMVAAASLRELDAVAERGSGPGAAEGLRARLVFPPQAFRCFLEN